MFVCIYLFVCAYYRMHVGYSRHVHMYVCVCIRSIRFIELSISLKCRGGMHHSSYESADNMYYLLTVNCITRNSFGRICCYWWKSMFISYESLSAVTAATLTHLHSIVPARCHDYLLYNRQRRFASLLPIKAFIHVLRPKRFGTK